MQEYRKNEDFKKNMKVKLLQKALNTEHGKRDIKSREKNIIMRKMKKNSNYIFDKKSENKSKEKININKLLRKNIISLLFNQKKSSKRKDTKSNLNDKKNSINATNIKYSFNSNQKISNIVNNNRSNNNINNISSTENLFKKPHSKTKEKLSKLTKNFDINILNIEYLNTDINEVDKKNKFLNKNEYLKKFIIKPKSNKKEECKNNNIMKKNYLLINTNFSNIDFSKKEKIQTNKYSNKIPSNNYFLIKDNSTSKENHSKNKKNRKRKLIKKEENITNNKNINIINNKSLNQINKKKINTNINKFFNLPSKENEFNFNNIITCSQSSNKNINNKNIFINKVKNPTNKNKYINNNTLSNLNDNYIANDLNFNQKIKNKKNINSKNNKENNINIRNIKKSISKKNKLIGLTKKKSFFTIRDTVINFDAGNGKIIILPTSNKSKEKEYKKDFLNKKSKSQQGLLKSSNNKAKSNYFINKINIDKASSSFLNNNNNKQNELSSKTHIINIKNKMNKELSFNKENILYNYCNYKEKNNKSTLIKNFEENKNSGFILFPQNLQNSQEKNYSKFNRIKIEEYYRNNMNINNGNNHKINKINLINNKNKKKHCITNLYMDNNFKIDITGNFKSHKQKMGNIIKTNITNNSKNDFNINKNISNSSNNIIINLNDKNENINRSNNISKFKSNNKKIINLTHRTENSIQTVLKNIIKKF